MPITINYNQFATPTGNIPIAPLQPYQYSGIATGITSLDKNDATIIFTNLPSGLRITNTGSTAPFDSVFVSTDGYIFNSLQYIQLKYNSQNKKWIGTGSFDLNYYQIAYTSGGFWAQYAPFNDNIGRIINTGSGNINSSILDIQFQTPNIDAASFVTPTTEDIILQRGGSYDFSDGSGSFPNVYFHQETNDSWYPAHIQLREGSSLYVRGFNYNGDFQSIEIAPDISASGHISYNGGSLVYTPGPYPPPAPIQQYGETFDTFIPNYPIESINANEIMSSYTVLYDNAGNSGTAAIQVNNVEQFSDLVSPLRKLHVVFKRPNT